MDLFGCFECPWCCWLNCLLEDVHCVLLLGWVTLPPSPYRQLLCTVFNPGSVLDSLRPRAHPGWLGISGALGVCVIVKITSSNSELASLLEIALICFEDKDTLPILKPSVWYLFLGEGSLGSKVAAQSSQAVTWVTVQTAVLEPDMWLDRPVPLDQQQFQDAIFSSMFEHWQQKASETLILN